MNKDKIYDNFERIKHIENNGLWKSRWLQLYNLATATLTWTLGTYEYVVKLNLTKNV